MEYNGCIYVRTHNLGMVWDINSCAQVQQPGRQYSYPSRKFIMIEGVELTAKPWVVPLLLSNNPQRCHDAKISKWCLLQQETFCCVLMNWELNRWPHIQHQQVYIVPFWVRLSSKLAIKPYHIWKSIQLYSTRVSIQKDHHRKPVITADDNSTGIKLPQIHTWAPN